MKKLLRLILKTLGAIIALLALYALAGLTLYRIPVNKDVNYKAPNDVTIFIKSNGVHTDIVVPVKNRLKDWRTLIRPSDTGSADTVAFTYVGIGWGDKGFYLQTPEWKDLKLSVALKAAFHLSTSAIHATFYNYVDTGGKCVQLQISNEDYLSLVKYIEKSFLLDSNNSSIHIVSANDGYGDTDVFYEAKGSYSFFYTCNTWANNALKAAHQRAALWALMDKGIFYHYKD